MNFAATTKSTTTKPPSQQQNVNPADARSGEIKIQAALGTNKEIGYFQGTQRCKSLTFHQIPSKQEGKNWGEAQHRKWAEKKAIIS